jgi:hypothetical protein
MTRRPHRETVTDQSQRAELSTIHAVVRDFDMARITTRMGAGVAVHDGARSSAMSEGTPTVFIVDDDVSVREALIGYEEWQVETLFLRGEISVPHTVLWPKLPGARRQSAGPQWTRSPKGHRCRSDDFHHRPRRRSDVGPGHEGRRRRIPDQNFQRRRATGHDPARHRLQRDSTRSRGEDEFAPRPLRVAHRREQQVMGLIVTGLMNNRWAANSALARSR